MILCELKQYVARSQTAGARNACDEGGVERIGMKIRLQIHAKRGLQVEKSKFRGAAHREFRGATVKRP